MSAPAPAVRQQVEATAELTRSAEGQVSRHHVVIAVLTEQLGQPRALYGLLVMVVLWVAVNGLVPRLRWDEPPFPWLQALLTLLSITTTTVVLITQHRWLRRSERRSQLDLHINLQAEEKIAKLVALLEELRRDLPTVRDRHDPQAAAMSQGTDARAVLEELEREDGEGRPGHKDRPPSEKPPPVDPEKAR